eukprot:SAG31_NODE_8558_length_1431_cov_0.777027_1_plen_395_part_00
MVERSAPALRARAISWTIGASVVAAAIGPHYAQLTKDGRWLPVWAASIFAATEHGPSARGHAASVPEYVGTYVAVAALAFVYLLTLAINTGLPPPARSIHPPAPKAQVLGDYQDRAGHRSRSRSTCELLGDAGFVVALLAQVGGNAGMVFIMCTTPLAMSASGFSYADIANVVTLHALGMYVPGFVTGELIRLCSPAVILSIGSLCYVCMVACGLTVLPHHHCESLAHHHCGWSSESGSLPHHHHHGWSSESGSDSNDGSPCHAADRSSDWGGSAAPVFGTLRCAWIGWNFVFTTGSALLVAAVPGAHHPDKKKAQGISESMAIVGSCSGTVIGGLVWGISGSEWRAVCWCAAAGPVLMVSLTAIAACILRWRSGALERRDDQSEHRGRQLQFD